MIFLGQIAKASGTNARTGGTFVPLVTQLKYALSDRGTQKGSATRPIPVLNDAYTYPYLTGTKNRLPTCGYTRARILPVGIGLLVCAKLHHMVCAAKIAIVILLLNTTSLTSCLKRRGTVGVA